jgi:hypothetical protein
VKYQEQAARAGQVLQAAYGTALVRKSKIRSAFAWIRSGGIAVVGGLDMTIPNLLWNRETSVAEPAELTHCGGFLA